MDFICRSWKQQPKPAPAPRDPWVGGLTSVSHVPQPKQPKMVTTGPLRGAAGGLNGKMPAVPGTRQAPFLRGRIDSAWMGGDSCVSFRELPARWRRPWPSQSRLLLWRSFLLGEYHSGHSQERTQIPFVNGLMLGFFNRKIVNAQKWPFEKHANPFTYGLKSKKGWRAPAAFGRNRSGRLPIKSPANEVLPRGHGHHFACGLSPASVCD